MSEQQLWNQLGQTVQSLSVLELIVLHLLVETAKSAPEPDEWLRSFADKVHASVDKAPDPPENIKAKIEAARDEIDRLMVAARNRLKN